MPAEPNPENKHPKRPSQLPTASLPPHRSSPNELWIVPTHIGPYVVRREIGSGGMGSVYECYDEHLKRAVAVKVAHPAMAARPDVLEQIRSEGQKLASVKDKRFICRVLSAGDVLIGGVTVPYVAMEYEPDAETMGGPISNAWSMQRKVAFFLNVCAAVRTLHEQYLVHADIKPSNVLVVKDEPRLIDFGIARVVRTLGGERGQPVAGTPGYMDPAVLSAPGAAPDQRSDIYALGMTLAEFLSGHAPELDPSGEPSTPPTWPSVQKPPSRENRSIDRELDAIILRAIDTNPAERFQSVKELRDRLADWLSFHRSLPARIGDSARSVGRSASLLFLRSRPIGTAAIVLLCSIVALACSPILFRWTSIAVLTQSIPGAAATLDRIENVRVIDAHDYPALVQLLQKRGISIDLGRVGDMRLAWAELARKLAGLGSIRAVGFDLFFTTSHPADSDLLQALTTLADSCDSKCVVLSMDQWFNVVTPLLAGNSRLRVATAKINPPPLPPAPPEPPFMQLALRHAGDAAALPSFPLVLAGLELRPDCEIRVEFQQAMDKVLVTFELRTPSGVWVRSGTDKVELPDQQIQPPNQYDGPRFNTGDLLARFAIPLPTQEAIDGCTKSAAEVLEMPAELLRLWIGKRTVIVMGAEDPVLIGNRMIFPAYLNASVVESLATMRIVRIPSLPAAFALTLAAATFGALLAWGLLGTIGRFGRWMLPISGVFALAGGIFITFLACRWLMQSYLYFVNPMILCLAVTLAGVAVVVLGRANRAILGIHR